MANAILTTCWETFEGSTPDVCGRMVRLEKLWLLLPRNGGERRFLGLVSDVNESAARDMASACGYTVAS